MILHLGQEQIYRTLAIMPGHCKVVCSIVVAILPLPRAETVPEETVISPNASIYYHELFKYLKATFSIAFVPIVYLVGEVDVRSVSFRDYTDTIVCSHCQDVLRVDGVQLSMWKILVRAYPCIQADLVCTERVSIMSMMLELFYIRYASFPSTSKIVQRISYAMSLCHH